MYCTTQLMLLGLACLLCTLWPAHGLSYPLCTSYGSSWVTDSPHLTGQFPYYDLIFSCRGDINIEGRHIDYCMNNGKDCGQPVAEAVCQYLGFDGAVADQLASAVADAPARSLTGEWCVAQNVYESPGALNRTQFEALSARAAARAGPPCTRVDAVTCFRTRASLRKAWDARALHPAAVASAPTPAVVGSGAQQGVEPLETLAANAPQPSVTRGVSAAATAVGGRRRLRSA